MVSMPAVALSFALAAGPDLQEPGNATMTARVDARGQVVLAQGERTLLQYNARRVDLPDGYLERIAEANRTYARPRSGYLHPLHGLDGEPLTLDWSVDHPHHRGIYWAWPEVRCGERIGDLHALQRVCSRPVGEPVLASTAELARVEAMNLWMWDDGTPVVFERVVITAHARAADGSGTVDLDLRLLALAGGVSLARRDKNLYGGLNTRLAPVEGLTFGHHATSDAPRRGWSTATGTWQGGERVTTLAILEHPTNPAFPGDLVTYEYLPWFQPTFPRAGTVFALQPERPLVLRYRFLILPGEPDHEILAAACDRYAASESPFQNTATVENER